MEPTANPPRFTNRLSRETSPYLLQHAHNPVDWYPWGEEALTRARVEDRPILLSIGYSACHWCHVMEHESFESEPIAQLMNDNYICIKVDREERPDLDGIYMNAVQMMTGHGGWPMTCFLTPDGRPFFCGTYYPKPQFLQLLAAVTETWRERRGEVEEASDHIAGELRRMSSGLPGGGPEITPALCDHAVTA
ncbi:MAG: thioredoxin domain-containing protein, partial [Acidobacteriota bacterium]